MTDLQEMMLEHIPSDTMREYLAEKMSSGEYVPSCEDIAATVFNCGKDIFVKADIYKLLLNEALAENTRKELEWHITMAEKVRKYIENKDMRYAFECSSLRDDLRPVYNSFKKALKHMKRNGCCYAAVADKHIRTSDKYVAELVADENGNIIKANNYHRDWWSYPHGTIAHRYVKYPIPFAAGDTVYYTGDKDRKLFCVINAELPDYSELLDSFDASITVIPYRYKEYAAPENIKAHYERLKERRRNGLIFYDESTEHDVISREHDHMCVLYAELWKENEYCKIHQRL